MPVVVRRLSVGLQDPSSQASGPPGAFYDADVFGPFSAQLEKLWHLWELVCVCLFVHVYLCEGVCVFICVRNCVHSAA